MSNSTNKCHYGVTTSLTIAVHDKNNIKLNPKATAPAVWPDVWVTYI